MAPLVAPQGHRLVFGVLHPNIQLAATHIRRYCLWFVALTLPPASPRVCCGLAVVRL